MDTFIVNRFSKEGISDIDFAAFEKRIADDEFVILLDGFDEMTRKIDADEKGRNFDKIRRIIDSSKVEHFARNRTSREINHFILEQGPEKEALLKLVLNARDLPEQRCWQGTNAATILIEIDNSALTGLDLSCCQLSHMNLNDCDCTGTNFQQADLSYCSFTKEILSARLQGAKFEDSRLNLFDAKIKYISFLE